MNATVYKVTYEYPDGTRGELVDRFRSQEAAQAAIDATRQVWQQRAPRRWHIVPEQFDPDYFEKWNTTFNGGNGYEN